LVAEKGAQGLKSLDAKLKSAPAFPNNAIGTAHDDGRIEGINDGTAVTVIPPLVVGISRRELPKRGGSAEIFPPAKL
jgi:hypothetical protein